MVCLIYCSIVSTILERIGYYFSKLVRVIIALFMQAAQYVGKHIVDFLLGALESVLEQMPGVSSEQISQSVVFARAELEKWNAIFPIYEALTCMAVIFSWRIAIGLYRAFITIMWNASNIHNAMPKIGGTG